jgi:hypothetical protein
MSHGQAAKAVRSAFSVLPQELKTSIEIKDLCDFHRPIVRAGEFFGRSVNCDLVEIPSWAPNACMTLSNPIPVVHVRMSVNRIDICHRFHGKKRPHQLIRAD